MWTWQDGSPNFYNGNVAVEDYSLNQPFCSYVAIVPPFNIYIVPCSKLMNLEWYFCETQIEEKEVDKVRLQSSSSKVTLNEHGHLYKCELGHFSQLAFACDPESQCSSETHLATCTVQKGDGNDNDHIEAFSIQLFPCETSGQTVQYSMMCDFRSDCFNSADEKHCEHPHEFYTFK